MMPNIKRVIDYSGLDYHGALQLPCDVFMLMVKHSVIDSLMQTEDGRKYLEDCERLNTTTIDLDGLQDQFGKENE